MAGRRSGHRILLVDDDQIILDTISYGLKTAGYRVQTSLDAAQALTSYKNATPDLVIVDIELPDMRGTELAQAFLALRYRPILVLSSHAEPEWIDRAIGSGVIGYLVKPLSVSQLVPSIETALARFSDINHRIARQFHIPTHTEEQLVSVMDAFSFGIIIIDSEHRIIYSNATANKLTAPNRLLMNRDGKLRLAKNGKEFARILDRCLDTGPESRLPVVSLIDTGTENDVQLWGAPLPSPNQDSGKSAIVIINDPSRNIVAPSGLLKSLYGFTKKEANLAHELANGTTINQYCEDVFISQNTARTHLKSIYRKTGTNRQADLVRLLSRLFINLSID